MLVSLTPLSQQDMEIGRQEGSDWAMEEFQQRLRALRGGEEDSQTHTPAKKAKIVIAEGEAQGDERVFLFPSMLGAWEAFIDLCHSWRSFKRDLNVIEEEFNGEEDTGEPKYEYNDKWFEDAQEGYYEIIEKSDEILAANAAPSVPNEEVEDKISLEAAVKQKKELKLVNDLGDQLDSLTTAITNSIKKIGSEVDKMVDGEEGVAVVQASNADLGVLRTKLMYNFRASIVSMFASWLTRRHWRKSLGRILLSV